MVLERFFGEDLESFKKLYVHELQDLVDAEQQIVDALPKMAEKASSADLRTAFLKHCRQSEVQKQRVQGILQQLGESTDGVTCEGVKGLIKEGQVVLRSSGSGKVLDAALIGLANKVEHYEIAAYGTVRTFADVLGYTDQAKILDETLKEEGETDRMLSRLAEENVNVKAASTTGGL